MYKTYHFKPCVLPTTSDNTIKPQIMKHVVYTCIVNRSYRLEKLLDRCQLCISNRPLVLDACSYSLL
jgi:hypothetical protein